MELKFNNPKDFESFIRSRLSFTKEKEQEAITEGLTVASEFLTLKAKEKFGHYPSEIKWEDLSDATKKDRVRKGFTENDPLLRDGTLRESVSFVVAGNHAEVGSTSEIMVYQENGTRKTGWGKGIPPRPVFLLTQIVNGKEAVSLFAKTFFKVFRA